MPQPEPFATSDDVATAWRPLTPEEITKADYWLERVSRQVRRLWPHTDSWIAQDRIDAADVRDAVVDIVTDVLDVPGTGRRVRSYSRSSGQESESYTLRTDATRTGVSVLTQGLLDLLGMPVTTAGAVLPRGQFPPAPGFDNLDRPRRAHMQGHT